MGSRSLWGGVIKYTWLCNHPPTTSTTKYATIWFTIYKEFKDLVKNNFNLEKYVKKFHNYHLHFTNNYADFAHVSLCWGNKMTLLCALKDIGSLPSRYSLLSIFTSTKSVTFSCVWKSWFPTCHSLDFWKMVSYLTLNPWKTLYILLSWLILLPFWSKSIRLKELLILITSIKWVSGSN